VSPSSWSMASAINQKRHQGGIFDDRHCNATRHTHPTAATIHKLETMIPVVQQRVDIRKTLMDKELGSKLNYFETLQLLVEQQEDLSVQKSHLNEAEAAVAAIRETRGQAVAEYRHTLSDELAKAEQKANGLAQDLIKAEQKTRLQLLTAPVDGVVQQLAIHTVGGVVTPAQSLLVVVPSDSRLEIEAMVSNRDIGFVPFNFTRYGLLHGQVLSISQDAVIRDRQQDRSNDRALGTQNDTSEPKGQDGHSPKSTRPCSLVQCSCAFFRSLALRVTRPFRLFRSSATEALIIGARCNEVQGHSKRREAQSFVAEHRWAGWVLGVHSMNTSARSRIDVGISTPIAFAVFRLTATVPRMSAISWSAFQKASSTITLALRPPILTYLSFADLHSVRLDGETRSIAEA
jgi:HlyD family secretion protein